MFKMVPIYYDQNCPWCGFTVPTGASVCRCHAVHGYQYTPLIHTIALWLCIGVFIGVVASQYKDIAPSLTIPIISIGGTILTRMNMRPTPKWWRNNPNF